MLLLNFGEHSSTLHHKGCTSCKHPLFFNEAVRDHGRKSGKATSIRRHLQPHTGVHENFYFTVCIVIFLSFDSVFFLVLSFVHVIFCHLCAMCLAFFLQFFIVFLHVLMILLCFCDFSMVFFDFLQFSVGFLHWFIGFLWSSSIVPWFSSFFHWFSLISSRFQLFSLIFSSFSIIFFTVSLGFFNFSMDLLISC
jgi:hypothetical protein